MTATAIEMSSPREHHPWDGTENARNAPSTMVGQLSRRGELWARRLFENSTTGYEIEALRHTYDVILDLTLRAAWNLGSILLRERGPQVAWWLYSRTEVRIPWMLERRVTSPWAMEPSEWGWSFRRLQLEHAASLIEFNWAQLMNCGDGSCVMN